MPASDPTSAVSPALISVAIGQWAVAAAPVKIRTLLGSCVGVILHDRVARLGGLGDIVLPNSRGSADHPGKFADTAIPASLMILSGSFRSDHVVGWSPSSWEGLICFLSAVRQTRR